MSEAAEKGKKRRILAWCSPKNNGRKNKALLAIARVLLEDRETIISENKKTSAGESGRPSGKYTRQDDAEREADP